MLRFIGLQTVRHESNDLAAAAMTENEEKLKSFLMRVKEESEKADLKLSTQKV